MLGSQVSAGLARSHEGTETVKATVRSGLRLSETLSNHAMQPTASAVGQQVKGHAGLAPAAADDER